MYMHVSMFDYIYATVDLWRSVGDLQEWALLPPCRWISLRSPGLALNTVTHGTILSALYNLIFTKATNEDELFFNYILS